MPTDTASPSSLLTTRNTHLANLDCIVLGLDDRGQITFLNPFGLHFFGYQQPEIIGSTALDTLFPENAHCHLNVLNPSADTGQQTKKNAHQLCECRRKNGKPAWIVWSSHAVDDANKKTTSHLCIGHDITQYVINATKLEREKSRLGTLIQLQQKQLQKIKAHLQEEKNAHKNNKKKIAKNQDRYRLFSEVTTEGILFHENGIALEVNEAFAAMVDCPRKKIIGLDVVRYFVAPQNNHQVKQKMVSSEDQVYEATVCSTTGRTFPVELRSRPGKLGGRPCRVACVRDISHRKKAERQMIQSQKMEAIGTLASGIAHDFNNMLAGIQGNVEVIRHQLSPDSPHHKGLDLVSQIVERGTRLSGQILGYARGGQSELTEINLNQLVEDTLDIFGFTNRPVSVQTYLCAETPSIRGDRSQIEQVVLNLMINALHAMPMGGEMTIETKPTILTSDIQRPYEIIPGNYAMLIVDDTGHGMDEETRKNIFEPFFTTKKMGLGTGLGLASTYGIIKNHNGYIDVTSQLEMGTRFSVLLPACPETKKTTPEDARAMDKGKQTILMVDDETDFLLLGQQILNLLGYHPITAENCNDALVQFKQSSDKIALVIMDMIMPDGDVHETIQRLREMKPNIRILLSSGHSQDGEIGRKLMPHCQGFIQKPFRLASISQKIKEMIGTTENENQ